MSIRNWKPLAHSSNDLCEMSTSQLVEAVKSISTVLFLGLTDSVTELESLLTRIKKVLNSRVTVDDAQIIERELSSSIGHFMEVCVEE